MSRNYRFTGKPVSQTTGLYYEYQRWYDPTIGRFISQDPFAGQLSDPQSQNPYLYVENTPTTYADPSGAYPNVPCTDTLRGCGPPCPSIFKDPLGAIACSFGFGPSGTVTGGGQSAGGGAGGAEAGGVSAGPIVGSVLFGIWAGVEIYNNWGTITTDWNNLWRSGGDDTTSSGGSNGNGGTTTGRSTVGTGPITTMGTGPTITLPNVGSGTNSPGTSGSQGSARNALWNFDWYPKEGGVNTSVSPPAKWKIAVCGAALVVGIGFFLAVELPQVGKSGEHSPEGILGGFAAVGVCVGVLIV